MDNLQGNQLVLLVLYRQAEIQAGIPEENGDREDFQLITNNTVINYIHTHTAGITIGRIKSLPLQKQIESVEQHPPLVNYLQISPVQEVTGAWLPCQHHCG